MGGTKSKTVVEGSDNEVDENQNENVGLFQITVEHVSGSFMTLFIIGLIVAILLAVRWFRKRRERTSDRARRRFDLEAQWDYRDPPGRAHRFPPEIEPRMELENLPKLFLVSNTSEAVSPESKQWSPSQARLKTKQSPV